MKLNSESIEFMSPTNTKQSKNDLDEIQVESVLQEVSKDTLDTSENVKECLSKFLDEDNVSMMGGWT